ncbi:stalk domain-containing protein [Candidatus Cryosericum terrychapinii]|nr:stalk domain-containing protein [Candidatus Cryosericum terrychapinii]
MKKFLSIFVALAMVFSLFAGTFAPRASAAVGLTIDATKDVAKITTSTNIQSYFTSFPSPLVSADMLAGTYVYKMGDTIHANVVFDTTTVGGQYQLDLLAWNGAAYATIVDSVTAFQTTVQLAGAAEALKTYPVQIGTGNVSFDGPYVLRVTETGGDAEVITLLAPVFIQYNLTWKTSTIKSCAQFNTIEGWITRGNGQTVLSPVIVGITYPNSTIAAYYTVAKNSSGQFSLTFPVDGTTQIGDFALFVRDSYPTNPYVVPAAIAPDVTNDTAMDPDNDAMIYDYLTNAPDISLTASTYYSPVLLYKNLANQPLTLQLVDQNGAYVTGALPTGVDNTGTNVVTSFLEVAPGFYRFILHTSATAVDARFTFTKTIYGSPETSNMVVINLRDLGPFNPFVDVNATASHTPVLDCETGRYVYDKLPCTIGNGLEIAAGMWQVADTDNWYIYNTNIDSSDIWAPNGPVRQIGTYTPEYTATKLKAAQYIIEQSGKITVSVTATIWERIDHTCPAGGWYGEGYIASADMATNACCHTYEKTFDICEVKSCTLTSVTLENGAQIDPTNITVGSKADLVVNVSGANAPAGLSCGCNTKLVHIYMVKQCSGQVAAAKLDDAFTLDTYGGGTTDVTDLWYNGIAGSALKYTPDATWSPDKYDTTGLNINPPDDGTVQLQVTTPGAIVIDNCEKLTFKGVTFNYGNDQDAPCGYQLVVEVFGLDRSFDACGNMFVSYPFISETLNDISINPTVTTLSSTATIIEAGIDPTDILAGVPALVEITSPSFTVDTPSSSWSAIDWTITLGGSDITAYGISFTATKIDTGYRFIFSCPMWKAGDLVITGTSYKTSTGCDIKQIVTVTEKVVLPAFDVKIGLADGSIIDNDHIITEGLVEDIYVVPTDPRADGHHDFTTDPNWNLAVVAVKNACGLPTSKVCGSTPSGCTTPSPISVYGRDNPHIEDTPQFMLYMSYGTCSNMVTIDTFSLVEPTVTVSPTEIPFTIPASATHLVFTVKDAHAHGAPGVTVTIFGTTNLIGAGASGYSYTAGSATTDKNGEADWAFVPPYSGDYSVGISMNPPTCFVLPCGWAGFGASKTISAKYQAPVVDTTAPVVTLATGLDGSTVSSSTLNLTGKVTDNVGVTQLFVGFNKVDVLPDGSFMVALKLVEGENTITVVAYDAAGNKGTTTAKVTYTPAVNTSTVLVLTIGADIVSVNGKATSIDAAPEIVASRTFVPIRFISEAFGATVEWLPETQGITITLGDHTIGLQIGNSTAVIDGSIISLPAAPYIKNGRTMVPLRVISESFGGDVVWDPAARTITITYTP